MLIKCVTLISQIKNMDSSWYFMKLLMSFNFENKIENELLTVIFTTMMKIQSAE